MPITRMANYFAARPGTEWGPRTINDYEFIYTVSGESRYAFPEGELRLQADSLLLIPPEEAHTFYIPAVERTTISCIHFDGSPLPGILRGHRAYDAGADRTILSLFRKCADEFAMRRLGFERLLDLHVEEIVVRLVRLHQQANLPQESMGITRAKAFLLDNYNRKIGRQDVAAYIGVTPEHLNYMFKRSIGRTPTDYLEAIRVDKACSLLTGTGMQVAEIAAEVGYEDPLYFSRVFKKRLGVSPRQFRLRV